MFRKKITQDELLSAVIQYEHNTKKAEFVERIDKGICLYKFKGSRKAKMVIVMCESHDFFEKLNMQLQMAKNIILSATGWLDNIELFTTAVITDAKADELESHLSPDELSLSVFDCERIKELTEFNPLKENVSQTTKDPDVDPAFFDYLAMSNESSDIKNHFFHALLLMDVYRSQPVEEKSFIEECVEKYHKSSVEIQRAVKSLRREGKLTALQKGNEFSLSDSEQRIIDKSVKESRSTEQEFLKAYDILLEKYKVTSGEKILERLKNEYLSKYNGLHFDEQSQENNKNEVAGSFAEFIGDILGDDQQCFIQELSELCGRTDYLDQYALNHAFLNLFRSDKYEEYLNKKEFVIYMDTPVIANYICSKSSCADEYQITWDNPDYLNALDLFGYQEENDDKIRFTVPHDYIQETIGELKKALQFSWFDQIKDAPIKLETSNIFYNFYCAVKNEMEHLGEDVSGFGFESFAKLLGFSDVNPDSTTFMKKNISYLRYFLKQMGVETLEMVDGYYDGFEKVKNGYEWTLHERGRDKTNLAINADVRQAFFITKEAMAKKIENREFYLVSWDNTLYKLRDIVRDELEITGHTYGIYKPGELADKLAFRNFRISKENVKSEVFAYANNSFNLTDKIRSLFDNVLTPYFASSKNKNNKLVSSLLKMEQSMIDGETDRDTSSRSDKTLFEEFFLSIVMTLPKHNCTKQNLRDFLVDENNNKFIISSFQEAFEKKESVNNLDIAERFCNEIKAYANVASEDIKLG